jgi:hypothetical protein
MTPNPKSPKESASEPADFANLFIKGVQRAADMQKKSLDVAAQQNAEAIESAKNASHAVPAAPAMFDMARQAFERYIEAQKSVIDQVVHHTSSMVETAKESGNTASKVAADFTKTIQQSIERAVEVEKKALDLAVQQAKSVAEAVKHK